MQKSHTINNILSTSCHAGQHYI